MGYIKLQIKTINFNDTVYVVVMPNGTFVDSTQSKVYSAMYGEVFFVPAEYQIMLVISPKNYYEQDKNGKNLTSKYGAMFIFET